MRFALCTVSTGKNYSCHRRYRAFSITNRFNRKEWLAPSQSLHFVIVYRFNRKCSHRQTRVSLPPGKTNCGGIARHIRCKSWLSIAQAVWLPVSTNSVFVLAVTTPPSQLTQYSCGGQTEQRASDTTLGVDTDRAGISDTIIGS